MEDERIVALFWERSEVAVAEVAAKYTPYLTAICQRILQDKQDAEECVNDVLSRAWESIPPHRPAVLRTFLGKIARNLSLNRFESRSAQKRGGGQVTLALSELEDCLPANGSVETACSAHSLSEAINAFLAGLPRENRILFVRRYWYLCPIRELAAEMHMREGAVKSLLFRLRNQLKCYLEKEGFME